MNKFDEGKGTNSFYVRALASVFLLSLTLLVPVKGVCPKVS